MPLPVLHPTRYLMQAVPFLVPSLPLWAHRAWQVFLWLATTAITVRLLVHRFAVDKRRLGWLVGVWLFVLMLIGPVYYHLQVPVIIILAGFHSDPSSKFRWPKSILALLIASAWAGISRVNWFPVPGLLAATLYLLETPVQPLARREREKPQKWQEVWLYTFKAVAWVVLGTAIAFATQALYIFWSGNEAEQFGSSFSSDLLWYRLLPNPTYPPGILPAIVLVSFPLLLSAQERLKQTVNDIASWKRYHPIRILGLAAILGVLFLGGTVVSVKIGGGSNLHNFDAYLVLLIVTTGTIVFDKAVPDQFSQQEKGTPTQLTHLAISADASIPPKGEVFASTRQQAIVLLSLAILAFFVIISNSPPEAKPPEGQVAQSLEIITQQVAELSQKSGEILFISERHLLTFQYVKGVPLVPEYEKVFLMEMAMAGNEDYLNKFYSDLRNHRFALIISEPLPKIPDDENSMFAEEDYTWVKRVSQYILCYYKVKKPTPSVHVRLFVPTEKGPMCP